MLLLTIIGNILNYIHFKQTLFHLQVFSVKDALKSFPEFDTRRLVEWQAKGYIQKLVNKWYLFKEALLDEMLQYRIGNCIYRPSYISMESALSYYHLIPEAVYSQQSVTTRKTISYKTPVGLFHYNSLKPELYFGYHVIRKNEIPVLMADAEKALLDYLYFHPSLKTVQDMESVRLNTTELQNTVDWERLDKYAMVFSSAALDRRINNLKKLLVYVDSLRN